MSALGHQPPRHDLIAVSALPPKAAAALANWRVRFGPQADTVRPLPVARLTLRMTTAMAVSVTDRLWEISDVVDVLAAWAASAGEGMTNAFCILPIRLR